MWILALACTSAGPLDPCTQTGIWDLSTGEAYPSFAWALEHEAEDICLGPGAYALPCGDFDQQPLRITGAGAEQTELRGVDCTERYFNGTGDYLLQDLSITTSSLFIQPRNGRVEVRDVVVRDLVEAQDSIPRMVLWGQVDIDGLEIRDAVLPNSYLNVVGYGSTVQDLWVHDTVQNGHYTLEFIGIALQDLRVEDNTQWASDSGSTFMFALDTWMQQVHFANNGSGELRLAGEVALSEAVFQDAVGEEGHLLTLKEDSTLRLSAAEFLRSGGVSMGSGSTLLLSDTDFQDLDCPILCKGSCLEPAAEVTCL